MRSFPFLLLVATGCWSENEAELPQAEAAAPTEELATQEALPFAEATLAALAKADLADGSEDKVATKCAGCSLAMDGDAEHILEVEGYSLHMCSGECKMHFEEDIAGNLGKLMN